MCLTTFTRAHISRRQKLSQKMKLHPYVLKNDILKVKALWIQFRMNFQRSLIRHCVCFNQKLVSIHGMDYCCLVVLMWLLRSVYRLWPWKRCYDGHMFAPVTNACGEGGVPNTSMALIFVYPTLWLFCRCNFWTFLFLNALITNKFAFVLLLYDLDLQYMCKKITNRVCWGKEH
jgi:hypothetical protein